MRAGQAHDLIPSPMDTREGLLEELVRRRFKWPKPFREVMLEHFDRWQSWKASLAASRNQ